MQKKKWCIISYYYYCKGILNYYQLMTYSVSSLEIVVHKFTKQN